MKANEGYTKISDLAIGIGRDKSSALRMVKRLGIKTHNRPGGGGGQKASFIADQDIQAVKDNCIGSTSGEYETLQCVFYFVHIMPSMECNITCGVTVNINKRMNTYKTAWPEAKLIKTFSCKQSHEKFLLDVVWRTCDKVGPEHFMINDFGVVFENIKTALNCV